MRLKPVMWMAAGVAILAFATSGFALAPTAPATQQTSSAVEPATRGGAATVNQAGGGNAGQGEGGHGEGDVVQKEMDAKTLLVTITVFVCLFLVLSKVAWKPILTGLRNRETAIRDSIEAAKRAKADAERATADMEARMAEAQRQASQQLNQAKADAQRVADTIRAQAEAESAALKDRTLREIDAAKQQALAEINSHAAELGTAVARKILQRNVTVDDQARLVEESLSQMARKN